jgi:hypothetical protein
MPDYVNYRRYQPILTIAENRRFLDFEKIVFLVTIYISNRLTSDIPSQPYALSFTAGK